MINYIVGDATDPKTPGNKIIAHICNNKGGWGAGFVLALSNRFSEPEYVYREFYKNNNLNLGDVQLVNVKPDIWVANMIAQLGYLNINNTTPLQYNHLETCLNRLYKKAVKYKASVHCPRIGCGLGGGKWEKVYPIIDKTLVSKNIDVFVYDI